MRVPFIDLNAQYREIKSELEIALKKFLPTGQYILGKELDKFEKEFASYCGRRYAVGVNSGTDALFLALLSLGIGSSDEVIVPVFTYIASAFAVSYTGARPVFVDVSSDNFNIDIDDVKRKVSKRTKAVMPVHLFGQTADMKPLLEIANKYNLKIVEDACQAHGAKYRFSQKKVLSAGAIGDIGCFSFYPTKNLSAFGDGGMVVTDDKKIYNKLLKLRNYGRSSRYKHLSIGYNSRLDSLQAMILRIKLKYLDMWNMLRRRNANIYSMELKDEKKVILPKEEGYSFHIYHMYVVRIKNRDTTARQLAKSGIETLIHYPIPLHLQPAYRNLGYKKGDFPVAEDLARQVLSLPIHPYLKEGQIRFVAKTLKNLTNKIEHYM